MMANISITREGLQLGRRRVLAIAGASLFSAPAIVGAPNLMRVHSLVIPSEARSANLAMRMFYHSLWCGLQSGRPETLLNNRRIPEHEARRLVAHAQEQGWLRVVPASLGAADV
jgi:hypothetical protein